MGYVLLQQQHPTQRESPTWTNLFFALQALMIAGGLAGYLSSGSIKSLVAGGASGTILLVLANVSIKYYHAGKLCKPATFASLLVSAALTAVMYKRFTDTGKIFPAAVLGVASALMAAFYAWNLVAGPKPPVSKKRSTPKAA